MFSIPHHDNLCIATYLKCVELCPCAVVDPGGVPEAVFQVGGELHRGLRTHVLEDMSGEAVGLLDEPLVPRLVGLVAEPLLLRRRRDLVDPRRQFCQDLEGALCRRVDDDFWSVIQQTLRLRILGANVGQVLHVGRVLG